MRLSCLASAASRKMFYVYVSPRPSIMPSTQRSFYTKEFLHADAFTHRKRFTQLLHGFYTEKLLHRTEKVCIWDFNFANFAPVIDVRPSFRARGFHLKFPTQNFTSVFDVRPSFRAKGLHLIFWHCKQFLDISACKIAILHQLLPFDLHFVGIRCIWSFKNEILHKFLTFDCAKGRCRPHKIRISANVRASYTHDPCRGLPPPRKFAFHQAFVRPTRTISAEGHVSMGATGLPLPP